MIINIVELHYVTVSPDELLIRLLPKALYIHDNALRTSTIGQNLLQLFFSLGWSEVEETLLEPFLQHPLKGLNQIHFVTVLIVDPPNNHDGRHGLEYDDPRYLHHEHTDGAVSECPPPTGWSDQSRSHRGLQECLPYFF